MAYRVRIGQRTFFGLRGNVHLHTSLSDGTLDHEALALLAAEEGLDFIIITDHNVYPPGRDAWIGKTLLLVGEEVHDTRREPQSSHLLCFDIQTDVAAHAADPQAVIDAVRDQGGFTFLAHPYERDTAAFLPEPNISWRDWDVEGYAGLELWNYMSEFKGALRSKAQAVLFALAPALAISGPYPETRQRWDELLGSRPVAALGGSDAHGTIYHLGPFSRPVQPYDYLFRCLNTHLLTEDPLTGDLEHDKRLIYQALKAGHGFLGYEQVGSCPGFGFWARSGGSEATMGESLSLRGRLEVRATVPHQARLRLLRDGQVVAQNQGHQLALVSWQPGVYRLEVCRQHAGRERGWIFSNPIYVR